MYFPMMSVTFTKSVISLYPELEKKFDSIISNLDGEWLPFDWPSTARGFEGRVGRPKTYRKYKETTAKKEKYIKRREYMTHMGERQRTTCEQSL